MNEEISFTIKRNRKLLIYTSQPDRCDEFLTSDTYGGLDQEIAEEGGEKAGEEREEEEGWLTIAKLLG